MGLRRQLQRKQHHVLSQGKRNTDTATRPTVRQEDNRRTAKRASAAQRESKAGRRPEQVQGHRRAEQAVCQLERKPDRTIPQQRRQADGRHNIFAHKNYAADIMPQETYDKAEQIAQQNGFEFNCINYDPRKPNIVRLDQAPDFDTAREPITGDWIKVDTDTGQIVGKGHSDQIWHHKWLWVKDDYQGFDVNQAFDWSKQWSQHISNPDGLQIVL